MSIERAIEDFRYLINRGYRKDVALNFVANHYKLSRRIGSKLLELLTVMKKST